MSNQYKHGERVPSYVLCARLDELADCVTKGPDAVRREFTMRVPAELDRDADLVISEAAIRIRALEAALASIEGESVGETHNKEVVICNHGKVFGNYDWYTFNCPACNAQVSNREDCKCGQQLQWPEVSDE